MANPARKYDEPVANDPRLVQDPFNPVPSQAVDPAAEPRAYANDPIPSAVENRVSVQAERGTGTSVLIAAVVLALAVIAYFAFSGDTTTTTAPDQPAATAPADPAAPAPAEPAPAQ